MLCRGEVLAVQEAGSLMLPMGAWPGQRSAPAVRGWTVVGWWLSGTQVKAGLCWAEESEGPPEGRRGR